MQNKTTSAIAVATLVLLCSSCLPRAFTEMKQPAALVESVVLRTATPLLAGGRDLVSIKRVDGRYPAVFEHQWVIEPGEHDVEVHAELYQPGDSPDSSMVTKAVRVLRVTAAAGQELVVQAYQRSDEVWIWIEEAGSRAVVAGEAPNGR